MNILHKNRSAFSSILTIDIAQKLAVCCVCGVFRNTLKRRQLSLCLRTSIPQFAYFYLNGNSDTSFSVGTEGLNIIADGLTGEMTCGYAPVSSLIPETAPLTLSENCSLDFSNAAINGSIYIAAGDDPAFNSVLPIDSFVEGNHYE